MNMFSNSCSQKAVTMRNFYLTFVNGWTNLIISTSYPYYFISETTKPSYKRCFRIWLFSDPLLNAYPKKLSFSWGPPRPHPDILRLFWRQKYCRTMSDKYWVFSQQCRIMWKYDGKDVTHCRISSDNRNWNILSTKPNVPVKLFCSHPPSPV